MVMRIHCLLAVVEEVILDHFISVRHIRCVREHIERISYCGAVQIIPYGEV